MTWEEINEQESKDPEPIRKEGYIILLNTEFGFRCGYHIFNTLEQAQRQLSIEIKTTPGSIIIPIRWYKYYKEQ